jgi:Flp pilus assembly protein TadD
LREALALQRQLGTKPEALADCMRALASSGLSVTEEGESLIREALALHRQVLESDHPKIAGDLNLLGQCLLKRGKFEEAETVLRQTLELHARVHQLEPHVDGDEAIEADVAVLGLFV